MNLVSITHAYTRRGMSRYRVRVGEGMPCEFLIQAPPGGKKTREWRVLFARGVADALRWWANYHEERHETDVRHR